MTLLVVTGMMNLAMIALTALAITVERVAREPALVVRLAGLLVIGAGALEIVRAAVGFCRDSRSILGPESQRRCPRTSRQRDLLSLGNGGRKRRSGPPEQQTEGQRAQHTSHQVQPVPAREERCSEGEVSLRVEGQEARVGRPDDDEGEGDHQAEDDARDEIPGCRAGQPGGDGEPEAGDGERGLHDGGARVTRRPFGERGARAAGHPRGVLDGVDVDRGAREDGAAESGEELERRLHAEPTGKSLGEAYARTRSGASVHSLLKTGSLHAWSRSVSICPLLVFVKLQEKKRTGGAVQCLVGGAVGGQIRRGQGLNSVNYLTPNPASALKKKKNIIRKQFSL